MDLETGEELIALKEAVQDIADPTSDGEPAEEADEYARNTGLTIDSRNWPAGLDHETLIASTLAPTSPGELIELPDLQECAFRSIITPGEELAIPQNAVDWLHQLVGSFGDADVAKLVAEISTPSNLKLLKFEEPFLRSNPDADRRALASKLAAFSQASLSNHRLPLHPVDPAAGEGLEFPIQVRSGDKSLTKEIDMELFKGGQEMQDYVYKVEKTPWSDDEQRGIMESVLTYEGLVDQGYMTPPLSPLRESHTEPADYFVPDPETCLVPEPSTICSELENGKFESEIEAAEKKIFKEDNDFWQSVGSGESYSLQSYGYDFEDLDIPGMIKTGEVSFFTSSQISTSPPPKADDLKLESPLLPHDKISDKTSEPQRVIKPEDLKQAKELIESDDGSIAGDRGFSDFLHTTSEKMMRTAEQEKLSSVNGITRVPVPVMDFSAPKSEWSDGGCDTPMKMFAWIREHTKHVNWIPARWPSNRIVEQRMVWAPIPHIRDTKKLGSGEIEVDEKIIARFIGTTMDHEVVTSMDCVVKTPGFAVLRDYDDDDEMLDEEAVFERKLGGPETQSSNYGTNSLGAGISSGFNTASLGERMKQRSKKTRDAISSKKHPRANSDEEDDWGQRLPVPQQHSHRESEAVLSRESKATNMAMMDSALTLRGLVNEGQWDDHTKLVKQHTKIHSHKKPKVNSRFFGSASQTEPDDDEATSSSQRRKKQEEDARAMPPPPKPILALSPAITLSSPPPKIIIATSISGLLVMELRNLIPGLGIVLRDYDKRRPRGWYPGLRSTNMDEADIALSPATGILLTTMVKLRQKSLPGMVAQGQGSNGGNFQHVVENVATRYERLIVFVSEGNKHSETITPLLGSDANALVEFQGFAAGLASSCDISVVYLGGGHETLARWIAATVCQYADESAALVEEPLLEEETCWELFLRRAGMNPFGAQAVLGILKNTWEDDEPAIGGNGAMYGLPLFVMMTAEERIVMFEDVFRGRRVLNRVTEVLDAEWPPVGPVLEVPGDEMSHPYLQGSAPITHTGEFLGQEGFQHRGV